MVHIRTDGLLSLQVDRHMALGSRTEDLQASSNHDWKRIYGSLLMSDSRRALSEYSFLKSETLLWRGWTSLIHLVGCLDNLKDVEIPIVLTRTPLKLTNLMLQIILCPNCRIVRL